MTKAFVFDLYGTLLRRGGLGAHRDLPRALGINGSDWIRFVRDVLMVQSFESNEDFARFVSDELVAKGRPDLEQQIVRIVEEETGRVTTFPAVKTLLRFLKARGYELGLVSNLASTHKAPLDRAGIGKYFDEIYFSCDEGRQKPDPKVFAEIASRLGVDPQQIVVVGDSLANDLIPARDAGMRALGIGRVENGWVAEPAGLGLLSLESLESLLKDGHPWLGENFQDRTEPVADDDQGSYNLVFRCAPASGDGPAHYIKRFALPESVFVEDLAYTMLRETGIGGCRAAVAGESEPVLIVEEAPGEKWSGGVDPDLAWEIGRHMAFAYVFSSADARPRNAFLSRENGRPRVTMIDLEHCFFDLAIDTEGIDDPFDPHLLNGVQNLESRVVRRVLSEKSTRRTRRTFLKEEEDGEECLESFGRGWVAFYEALRSDRKRIVDLLSERVHRKPYLIIGTRSYRRAMAQIDVDHIARRLEEDPEENFIRYQ